MEMEKAMQEATKFCHRHDPDTSFDAAKRLIRSGELSRQKKLVCEAIVAHAKSDFTAKELAPDLGKKYHLISRRLSGLEDKLIERTMLRRNGCKVWRLKNDND